MLIGELFDKDVTRDIPPVVYFHEQDAEQLRDEVGEYIITGGYPESEPRGSRAAEGIHEQFVRLLAGIKAELDKPGGPALPAAWISGFYGSGKSSFGKLLGLSLDRRTLPDGTLLSEALLRQNHSPRAPELRQAWEALVRDIHPLAVVFDMGSVARGGESIHSVLVRRCQLRLGYCATSSRVADYELRLELDGLYSPFLAQAEAVLGQPWAELKDRQLAEHHFSRVMHALEPELFASPTAWLNSRAGQASGGPASAEEAVCVISQMLAQRYPAGTLFMVVDEVSQYLSGDPDRLLALQSLISALGQRMKGQAWLLATGQQRLDDSAGAGHALGKLKDRFPAALRVHLGSANIRDVVHRRLLRKQPRREAELRRLFQAHRAELALHAYQGEQLAEQDFVEVYPMLPGYIELLLQITTGLRARSAGAQRDTQAIRGLLQLLGSLFREQQLAGCEVGCLLTLDRVFEVLHPALEPEVQATLAHALERCAQQGNVLWERVVKAVALLELAQPHHKADAELLSQCLYARLGQGSERAPVQQALDELSRQYLLGYSEKAGYQLQSSAGQQWQQEREAYVAGAAQLSAQLQEALAGLMGNLPGVALEDRPLPWRVLFSDALGQSDVRVTGGRTLPAVTVDFRVAGDSTDAAADWVQLSSTPPLADRILWVAGDDLGPREAARSVVRSERMLERYTPQLSSLTAAQQRLLIAERNRLETGRRQLGEAVARAWLAGTFYFRGRQQAAAAEGGSFRAVLTSYATRAVCQLYPHPVSHRVSDQELLVLIEQAELLAPPPVLCEAQLGILSLDAGRYEATCRGLAPTEVLRRISAQPELDGGALLTELGRPPLGYSFSVVRACLVGLLRAQQVCVRVPGVGELLSVRDPGVRELLLDRNLRRARFSAATRQSVSPRDRNAICKLLREQLQCEVERADAAIADAVVEQFAAVRERLTALDACFRRLPGDAHYPVALAGLARALEDCRRSRQVQPTVAAVKRNLAALRAGLAALDALEADLGSVEGDEEPADNGEQAAAAVELKLHGREIGSEQELMQLLQQLEERLRRKLRRWRRIRLK
jgi:hypothetical protein